MSSLQIFHEEDLRNKGMDVQPTKQAPQPVHVICDAVCKRLQRDHC